MSLKYTCFILLLSLTMASAALAYPSACPGQRSSQDIMSGLSPEQQEKVTKVTGEHHKEFFALQKEAGAKEDALNALLAVIPADRAAVDQALDQLNDLRAKIAKLHVHYQISLSEIVGKPILMGSDAGCGPHMRPKSCPRAAADSGQKAEQP